MRWLNSRLVFATILTLPDAAPSARFFRAAWLMRLAVYDVPACCRKNMGTVLLWWRRLFSYSGNLFCCLLTAGPPPLRLLSLWLSCTHPCIGAILPPAACILPRRFLHTVKFSFTFTCFAFPLCVANFAAVAACPSKSPSFPHLYPLLSPTLLLCILWVHPS